MKKKHGIRLVSMMLIICMIAGLYGCSKTSEKAEDVQKEDEQKDTSVKAGTDEEVSDEPEISGTFELQIFSGGYGSEMWENAVAKFQEAYPELEVIANIDANVNAQMLTSWMKGSPPDFVFLDGDNIPKNTWLEEGKLLDLTDWYETATVYGTEELIKDKINKGILTSYKDSLYELPVLLSTWGMWYDSSLIAEKGLTIPSNFDELMSFGTEANEIGFDTLCYTGVYSGYLNWGFIMPAIAAYGEEYFNSVVNASSPDVFKDEKFVSVMKRYEEFVKAGNIMEGTVALNHTQSQMQWLNHDALLIPNGLWLENEMKDDTPDGFAMEYLPSPLITADQNPAIAITSATFGVSADGDNQAAALEFVRFLYQNDIMVDFVEKSGSPSACNVDISNAQLTDTAKKVQDIMNDTSISFVTKNGNWGDLDSVFNDCLNRMTLQEMTAEEACQKLYDFTELMRAE